MRVSNYRSNVRVSNVFCRITFLDVKHFFLRKYFAVNAGRRLYWASGIFGKFGKGLDVMDKGIPKNKVLRNLLPLRVMFALTDSNFAYTYLISVDQRVSKVYYIYYTVYIYKQPIIIKSFSGNQLCANLTLTCNSQGVMYSNDNMLSQRIQFIE